METSGSKKCKKENNDAVTFISAAQGLVSDEKLHLVLDLVIRSLQCSKFLRTCRLVCKDWNIAASATLRKKFVTAFQEKKFEFVRLKEFMELFPPKGNLPSPIQMISLKFRKTERENNFWNLARQLLERKDLVVTELEFHCRFFERLPTEFYAMILASVQHTLTSLNLTIEYSGTPWDALPNQSQLHLVNLKKLNIKQKPETMQTPGIRIYLKSILKNILHGSELVELTLDVEDFEFMSELLAMEGIDTVPSLQVGTIELKNKEEYDKIREFFWENPLRNLKGLAMSIRGTKFDPCPILSVFSETLELLSITFHGKFTFSLDLFPLFPNLRELKFDNLNSSFSGQLLLPQKLPSLKKLKLLAQEPSLFRDKLPHLGVECLDILIKGLPTKTGHNSDKCSYCKTRKDIAENHPNLTCYFPQNKDICFTAEKLWTINQSFPNLKALAIKWFIDLSEPAVPGFEMLPSDNECQQNLFENIFKDIFPLQNFLELHTLDLSGIGIRPEIIRYSLAKIPKLKHLRIEKFNFEKSRVRRKEVVNNFSAKLLNRTIPIRNEVNYLIMEPFNFLQYDDNLMQATAECLNHLKEVQIRFCRPSRNSIKPEEPHHLLEKLRPLGVTFVCHRWWCCYRGKWYSCRCEDCDHFGDFEFSLNIS